MARYGSDLIVDLLKAYDIEYVAMNPGASFRGIHDSLVNYVHDGTPKLIQCCHEEIAVAVAHGYAKASGKPMAVAVHDVVGLQHASMAIFNAWCDRVPMIVLGGGGPADASKRRPWIEWVHTALVQGELVREYVKWDDQPASVDVIPESFARAYRLAMTEPMGPVYICYDVGVQEAEIGDEVKPVSPEQYPLSPPICADPAAIKAVSETLVSADFPVIIADYVGRNPSSVEWLIKLAEILGAAVIDKGGRFNFPSSHFLDLTGSEHVLSEADVVLTLDVQDLFGSLNEVRDPERQCVSLTREDCKVIDISLRDLFCRSWAADQQRMPKVSRFIIADTQAALPLLVKAVRDEISHDAQFGARREKRVEEIKRAHEQLRLKWHQMVNHQSKGITPGLLALETWNVIRTYDWVLVNGDLKGWVRRVWDITKPGQYLGGSGGAGLGYGLGASIGAALALGRQKLCIDIQSDGDMLYTRSALWTAAHHKVPLLVIMYNNRSYRNSELHARRIARWRGRDVRNSVIGTTLEDPAVDFSALARSFGVEGFGPITSPQDLPLVLSEATSVVLTQQRPALIDVRVEEDSLGAE